jgi:hypothetical protein
MLVKICYDTSTSLFFTHPTTHCKINENKLSNIWSDAISKTIYWALFVRYLCSGTHWLICDVPVCIWKVFTHVLSLKHHYSAADHTVAYVTFQCIYVRCSATICHWDISVQLLNTLWLICDVPVYICEVFTHLLSLRHLCSNAGHTAAICDVSVAAEHTVANLWYFILYL